MPRLLKADYLKCTDTHCHECDYSLPTTGRNAYACSLLSMDVDTDDKGQPLRPEVCLEFGSGPTSKPAPGHVIDCTDTHCGKCNWICPSSCGLLSIRCPSDADGQQRHDVCLLHDAGPAPVSTPQEASRD